MVDPTISGRQTVVIGVKFVTTLGRTLTWSAQGSQRKMVVSVVPRDGRTTIRVDERLGPLAGGTTVMGVNRKFTRMRLAKIFA